MSDRRSSRDDEPRRRGRANDDDDRGTSRGRGRDDDRGGRGGRPRYEYQTRDPREAERRANQGANDFDSYLNDKVKMFKVNDGDNMIRILPPTFKNPKHYGLDIYVHYGVGPDRQTYLCLHKMKGEPCPICEERQEILADGDEKAAKLLEPKRRSLIYLIDRDREKDGLMAWAMPWTVDRDIIMVSRDKRSGEVLPIDHPEEGYDIEFEKKGQKDRTEYVGVRVARRSSPLGHDAWLDSAVDLPLDEALVYYDYDHIAKAFGGGGAHKDSRRERDDATSRDRGSSRSDRDDDSRRRDSSSSRDRDFDDRDRTGSGRDRGRDDGRGRRNDTEPLTWASIHEMTTEELDALCESNEDLRRLDPNDFDSDEELADAICEELGLRKTSARRQVDNESATRGRDDNDSKLAEMRRRRESRG